MKSLKPFILGSTEGEPSERGCKVEPGTPGKFLIKVTVIHVGKFKFLNP